MFFLMGMKSGDNLSLLSSKGFPAMQFRAIPEVPRKKILRASRGLSILIYGDQIGTKVRISSFSSLHSPPGVC